MGGVNFADKSILSEALNSDGVISAIILHLLLRKFGTPTS